MGQANSPQNGQQAVRVRQISLPRFEVEYFDVARALADAKALQSQRALHLPVDFDVAARSELVLDLRVANLPMSVTLLFRLIRSSNGQSGMEWLPRRMTDADALTLWIQALEASARQTQPPGEGLPPGAQQRLLDLCRRVVTANPFDALGLSWTCQEEDVKTAYLRLKRTLVHHRKLPGLHPRLQYLIDRSLEHSANITRELLTEEGRRQARREYAPAEELARWERRHSGRVPVEAEVDDVFTDPDPTDPN